MGAMKVLSGQRILGAIPRLKGNAMLMARFMPNTVELTSNINATRNGATLTPMCLSVGAPKQFGGLSGGLSMPQAGGFAAGFKGLQTPQNRYSIWGLFGPENEPEMFVTVKEYSATVGTVAVNFIEAEFAKAKAAPMSLSIFETDPAKAVATTFPAEAGHARFSWQIS